MKKIFFCGICGISMSALAFLKKEKGAQVLGSDLNYRDKQMCLKNIKVQKQPFYKGIDEADEVVYSSAVKNCSELKYAIKKGKKIISRGELLGRIASQYNNVIAVAGSHGKTTTTAMIYHILKINGYNPTLHLGGNLKNVGNVVLGDQDFFITEACEYCDNFLYLYPTISVITNIEPEHLDYFKTYENEKKSFKKFEKQSKHCIKKLDYLIKEKSINNDGKVSFILEREGVVFPRINLNVGGEYNIENAIFAIQVCEKIGLDFVQIKRGLEGFEGVKKRCEKIDSKYPFSVYVDYAHHPKEIQRTAEYFRKICTGKCVAVFQPHTYSRTKLLLNDFVKSLLLFDEIICYKTYPAREKKECGIDESELAKHIVNKGKEVFIAKTQSRLKNVLKKYNCDDLVVFVGAGELPDKFDFNSI